MLIGNKYNFKHFDITLFILTILLMCTGVFVIYSASYNHKTGVSEYYYMKQIYWIIAGLFTFLFFSLLNYKRLVNFAYLFYILGVILLLFVLIKGQIGMGAQRWINIADFRLQPSEFFKIAWVLIIAVQFSDFDCNKLGFVQILKKSSVLVIPFILIFLQPDLGTATIFLATWAIALLFRGIKKITFILLLAISLIAVPSIWFQLEDYQKDRVLTFLNPEKDPFGAGYHIIQSKIAIGSGGFFGKGFLSGTQSHLNFLPEKHTDFVFSVLNEEFGFFGGMLLILLFFTLLIRILQIASITREITGKMICIAVASICFFQFFVNAAMTVGMMPVVGIPMPFISYGGSSLITFTSMLGIVNSIALNRFKNPGDL